MTASRLRQINALTLPLILASFLTGCASSGERAKVTTARLINPTEAPAAVVYSDKTSAAATAIGTPFGLVGAIIGSGIAAADRSAGTKRWAPVTAGRAADVLGVARDRLQARFTESGKLTFTDKASAQLLIKSIGYGVAHQGDQRFVASAYIGVRLQRPDGSLIWFRTAVANAADGARTLEQFKASPEAYRQNLAEAIDQASKLLVRDY